MLLLSPKIIRFKQKMQKMISSKSLQNYSELNALRLGKIIIAGNIFAKINLASNPTFI